MQVSVENASELERKVTVAVPEDQISERVTDKLKELGKTVRVDGFRRGKVPLSVVKRRFGPQARAEVLDEVLRSSLSDAIAQEELRPVGEPSIETGDIDAGQGLNYTATFEIFPTVTLAPIEQLTIERPTCEISDDDADQMVVTLREQNKIWEIADRASENGDQLVMDFEGTIDGEAFEGGTASDFTLELGAGNMIDGFEDGLLGTAAGESVNLDLKFPDNYQVEGLAGKPVQFAITVKTVSSSRLPELNDEFFAKFGVESGGEEAFRLEVRSNMDRERERAINKRFNSAVLESVAQANEIGLPSALVASEKTRMQQQALQSMMQQGGGSMSGFDPEKMDSMFEEPARKRVKIGLVMADLIKDAGITADPTKVRNMIESMAASYEDSAAVVKWYYEDPQRLQEVEAMCVEDDAVTWIAERAQVNEVSISFDDLMNPGQTD